MASQQPPRTQQDQADLLERIKKAELEAEGQLKEARHQADQIKAEARNESDRILKGAEADAERLRAEILLAGKIGIKKELDEISLEAGRDVEGVTQQKDKKVNLKGIVLSVLGM